MEGRRVRFRHRQGRLRGFNAETQRRGRKRPADGVPGLGRFSTGQVLGETRKRPLRTEAGDIILGAISRPLLQVVICRSLQAMRFL